MPQPKRLLDDIKRAEHRLAFIKEEIRVSLSKIVSETSMRSPSSADAMRFMKTVDHVFQELTDTFAALGDGIERVIEEEGKSMGPTFNAGFATGGMVAYCNDGSIPCFEIRRNFLGKWEILGVSDVHGMGSAEYQDRLFQFDEIISFSSFSGTAHLAVRQGGRWSLLEISDNGALHPGWKFISQFEYQDADSMLRAHGLDPSLGKRCWSP